MVHKAHQWMNLFHAPRTQWWSQQLDLTQSNVNVTVSGNLRMSSVSGADLTYRALSSLPQPMGSGPTICVDQVAPLVHEYNRRQAAVRD